MTYLIRKIKNIAITFLLISTGSIYADCQNSSVCGKNDDCCLPCTPVCCGGTGFVSAELLYWRPFENGLDTCGPSEEIDIVTSDGKVISKFIGKGRDPHFKWDPGYRLGVGYEFACSDWTIAMFWTHFKSHANFSHDDSISSPNNSFCSQSGAMRASNSLSTEKSSSLSSQCNENKHRWTINLDVVDLIAVYDYELSSCFNLRPFFGLRGAKIDQKLCIRDLFNLSNSPVTPVSSLSTTITNSSIADGLISSDRNNKQKFKGVGPLIGLEADWNIGCNFSIYAYGSVSWLYGRFRVRFVENDEFVDAVDFCKVRKHLDANLAGADAGLGIRWSTCFCNDVRLILMFGLEHHRYFDYNRFDKCGDLSFDGLNLGAAILF